MPALTGMSPRADIRLARTADFVSSSMSAADFSATYSFATIRYCSDHGRFEDGAVIAAGPGNPAVAERLVRAHAETVFNAATRKMTGGQNEFGAAKFSAALAGNAEQAAALEAAVRALPNGGARWDGFRKFMEVAESTGQRQRIGSQTAFNKEFMDNLSKGGAIGDALPIIKSGGTALPGMIRDRYAQYQLGKNTQELAKLITDPKALPVFRALAKEATGARAQAATLRLLAIAQQGKAAIER